MNKMMKITLMMKNCPKTLIRMKIMRNLKVNKKKIQIRRAIVKNLEMLNKKEKLMKKKVKMKIVKMKIVKMIRMMMNNHLICLIDILRKMNQKIKDLKISIMEIMRLKQQMMMRLILITTMMKTILMILIIIIIDNKRCSAKLRNLS